MTYSVEQRAEAMGRVLVGLRDGIPLTVICTEQDMPGIRTIYEWSDADDAFSADIARAREQGWDAIADRLRQTARGRGDSTADVQRDKLIVDTDLKLLAKWDPKRYGDKQLVGSDPDNPLPQGFTVNLIKGSPSASG